MPSLLRLTAVLLDSPRKETGMRSLMTAEEKIIMEMPAIKIKARMIVSNNAAMYCPQKALTWMLCTVNAMLPMRDNVPLVAKANVAKTVTHSRFPRLMVKMSMMILWVASKLSGGMMSFNKLKSST